MFPVCCTQHTFLRRPCELLNYRKTSATPHDPAQRITLFIAALQKICIWTPRRRMCSAAFVTHQLFSFRWQTLHSSPLADPITTVTGTKVFPFLCKCRSSPGCWRFNLQISLSWRIQHTICSALLKIPRVTRKHPAATC